jgi:hypothetical protein
MDIRKTFSDTCLRLYISISESVLFKLVAVMLFIALADNGSAHAYNGERFRLICHLNLNMVHGGFGALLMASAGVGAVVASAAGGFRIAWALVVVSVGAFTLREYQELWTVQC